MNHLHNRMTSRECPTCCSVYDSGNHRIRILSCGHSQCTNCMRAQFCNRQITCPSCRSIHIYTDINSIPVCYIAETLFGEKDAAPLTPKLHKGICEDHATYKLFWCSTHKQWLCTHCSVIKHPRGECNIIPIIKQLENSTHLIKSNIHEKLKHLDNTVSELKLINVELNKQFQKENGQLKKMETEYDKLTSSISQKEKHLDILKDQQSQLNALAQDCKMNKSELENIVTRLCDVKKFEDLHLENEKSAAIINRFNKNMEMSRAVQIPNHPDVLLTLTNNGINICNLQIRLNGPPRYVQ
ncbi:unnamed protein product, partial [Meganyctiphanes norvegica]